MDASIIGVEGKRGAGRTMGLGLATCAVVTLSLLLPGATSAVVGNPRSQVSGADRSATPQTAASVDAHTIALRRGPIDTRVGRGRPAGVFTPRERRRLMLVQFSAPPVDGDLEEIEATGAQIVHYAPQNAYLVWAGTDAIARALERTAAREARIQYYGEFYPDYALSPRLDDALASNEVVEVTVQLFKRAGSQDVSRVSRIAEEVLAGPIEVLDGRYINLRLAVRGSDLEAIASVESVVNVEPFVEPRLHGERQGQIVAGTLNASLQEPAGPGYLVWLASKGFSTDPADYPVVAVVDDGVPNLFDLTISVRRRAISPPLGNGPVTAIVSTNTFVRRDTIGESGGCQLSGGRSQKLNCRERGVVP